MSLKNLLKPLNQPFPEGDALRDMLRSSISVGLFIALFLYLFRPFDLNGYPGNMLLLALGFGAVTSCTMLVFALLVRYGLGIRKDLPSWTLGKWILQTLILITCIGIANYQYIGFLIDNVWRGWSAMFFMIANTFLIGILPTIILGLLIQMNNLRKNTARAKVVSKALHEHPKNESIIELASQNEGESLALPVSAIYYAEAMQNYVAIHHGRNGEIERTLLRSTIRSLAGQLAGTPVMRCHRSYLVNTDLIENVSGNAQGLRLQLHQLPEVEVPVSRSYISELKAAIA